MKNYTINYDTETEINKVFKIEAMDTQSAWDAFYYEVETEEKVTFKNIKED